MKFTFGIVTAGNDNFVSEIVQSIEAQSIPQYEILVVGSCNVEAPHLRVISFDESVKTGWITRKKNLITILAAYDNIVYLHDYVHFHKGWYEGQLQAGEDYSVRVDRTLNLDGTRAGDWLLCMWDSNIIASLVGHTLSCLLPYYITKLSRYMYISGAYFIAKKSIMLQFPLDESRSWGESEDVEWSRRVRQHVEFDINTKSTVQFLKQKGMPFIEPEGAVLEQLQELNNMLL